MTTKQNLIPMLYNGEQLCRLSPDSLLEHDLMELTIHNQQIYVSFYTSSSARSYGEKPLRCCVVIDGKPYYVGFNNCEALQSMFYNNLNTIIDFRGLV